MDSFDLNATILFFSFDLNATIFKSVSSPLNREMLKVMCC